MCIMCSYCNRYVFAVLICERPCTCAHVYVLGCPFKFDLLVYFSTSTDCFHYCSFKISGEKSLTLLFFPNFIVIAYLFTEINVENSYIVISLLLTHRLPLVSHQFTQDSVHFLHYFGQIAMFIIFTFVFENVTLISKSSYLLNIYFLKIYSSCRASPTWGC